MEKKLYDMQESILFHISGLNKVLLTYDFALPEKIKKSKNKNYGYSPFYDVKILKAQEEIFNSENQNKRIFVTNWKDQAVFIGKIKMSLNSKGKNIKTGEYVSMASLKSILEKQMDSKTLEHFSFFFEMFSNQASKVCLTNRNAKKKNSKSISFKEQNQKNYARNVELNFSKHAFSLDDGEYMNLSEFTSFLHYFFDNNLRKNLPSVVVQSKILERELIKRIQSMPLQKIMKNSSLFFFGQKEHLADEIRYSGVSLKKDLKKPKKMISFVPLLLATALSTTLGISYAKPSEIESVSKVSSSTLSYEIDKINSEITYETADDRKKEELSQYKIGNEITIAKGTNIYASSDHAYGGSKKYGELKEDSTSKIDRIAVLENGVITANIKNSEMSVFDCLATYSDSEICLHIEDLGWVDLSSVPLNLEPRVLEVKDVVEKKISGEVEKFRRKKGMQETLEEVRFIDIWANFLVQD